MVILIVMTPLLSAIVAGAKLAEARVAQKTGYFLRFASRSTDLWADQKR